MPKDSPPTNTLERLTSFFRHDLWKEVPKEARGIRSRLRRALRLTALAVRGFFRDEAIHHASALSFDTILALVPMLAIFFSTLKGLGAYEEFVDETVRPWILKTFGEVGDEQVGLREAFLQLLNFGGQTELAPLGMLGMVLVLYLVLLLLNTVELVLNRIWGVEQPRRVSRKVADYAAILFVAPFLLFSVAAMAQWEASIRWLGPLVHDTIVELMAIALSSLFFAFLYVVMPHTKVRFASAALGGVVAGAGWYGVLQLYALTQLGVARYNALYSSFAAVPLFLVWVFVSWVVVLFGAELAAAHHNELGYRWRVHHRDASPALKRFLGVRLIVAIAGAYQRGERPKTLSALAALTGVPEELANEVLRVFVGQGLVADALVDGTAGFVPARDLSELHVTELLDAIDTAPENEEFEPTTEDEEGRRLAGILQQLEEAAEGSEGNGTVRDIISWLEERQT